MKTLPAANDQALACLALADEVLAGQAHSIVHCICAGARYPGLTVVVHVSWSDAGYEVTQFQEARIAESVGRVEGEVPALFDHRIHHLGHSMPNGGNNR